MHPERSGLSPCMSGEHLTLVANIKTEVHSTMWGHRRQKTILIELFTLDDTEDIYQIQWRALNDPVLWSSFMLQTWSGMLRSLVCGFVPLNGARLYSNLEWRTFLVFRELGVALALLIWDIVLNVSSRTMPGIQALRAAQKLRRATAQQSCHSEVQCS